MTIFFRNNITKLLLLVAVVSATTIRCTEVNHQLGNNTIPESSAMTIVMDTLDGFEIHTTAIDSFKVSELLNGYMGSMISSRVGRVDAAYTSEVFTTLTSTTMSLVDDYVIDSAVLYMKLSSFIGNEDYPVTISMYELTENFRKPQNNVYDMYAPTDYRDPYYSNFNYKDYIADEPLLTFTVTPSEVLSTSEQIIVENLPEEFVQKVQQLSLEDYEQDSIFRKNIKGFCFVPKQTYGDGAILIIDPNSTSFYFEGYDKEKYEEEGVKEDGTFSFEFTHISADELYNQSITTLSNDVSWANSTIGIDPEVVNDTINSFDISYVGSLGSAMTKVTFPVDKIQALKSQLPETPSSQIIVTSAELIIPIMNPNIGSMNFSLSYLAAAYNFPASIYMPDLDVDDTMDLYNFDGKLDRSLKFYKMNVTRYIQSLLNNNTDYVSIDVFGDPMTGMFSDALTTIDNKNNQGVKLNLTYVISN